MYLKSLKVLSFLSLASLTLVGCSSKPKSISCDGLNFYGIPISYTADQEKIFINNDYTINFADMDEVTVKGSKIIINNNDPIVESFLGKGPYELSLKTCPTGITPAIQYFLNWKS